MCLSSRYPESCIYAGQGKTPPFQFLRENHKVEFQETGWVVHSGIQNLAFMQDKKRHEWIKLFSLPGTNACGSHFFHGKESTYLILDKYAVHKCSECV